MSQWKNSHPQEKSIFCERIKGVKMALRGGGSTNPRAGGAGAWWKVRTYLGTQFHTLEDVPQLSPQQIKLRP